MPYNQQEANSDPPKTIASCVCGFLNQEQQLTHSFWNMSLHGMRSIIRPPQTHNTPDSMMPDSNPPVASFRMPEAEDEKEALNESQLFLIDL